MVFTSGCGGGSYPIIAAGDQDVSDLDLKVYDSGGQRIAEDVERDDHPVVVIQPRSGGRFTIELQLYSADAPSFAAMVVLHEGGQALPLSHVVQALERYETVTRVIAIQFAAARFHDEDDQWALYGTVLNSGENSEVSQITMEDGLHAIARARITGPTT